MEKVVFKKLPVVIVVSAKAGPMALYNLISHFFPQEKERFLSEFFKDLEFRITELEIF